MLTPTQSRELAVKLFVAKLSLEDRFKLVAELEAGSLNRSARWSEADHPRAPDGKFGGSDTFDIELDDVDFEVPTPGSTGGSKRRPIKAKRPAPAVMPVDFPSEPEVPEPDDRPVGLVSPEQAQRWAPVPDVDGESRRLRRPIIEDIEQFERDTGHETGGHVYALGSNQLFENDAYRSVPDASDLGLSDAQRSAIESYTASGYKKVNGALRGEYPNNPESDAMVVNLDAAFEKAPALQNPIRVRRSSTAGKQLFGDPGTSIGNTLSDPAYASTSAWNKMPSWWNLQDDEVDITIDVPAGMRVLKPGSLSRYGDFEGEILLPRNTAFEIVDDAVDTTNGDRHIRLRAMMS